MEEGLLVGILGAAAVAVRAAASFLLGALHAEHAAAGGAHSVLPFRAPGSLEGPGIGNDALDAGRAAHVKRRGRESDFGMCIHSGHSHGRLDLAGPIPVFLVLALFLGFSCHFVAILWMYVVEF